MSEILMPIQTHTRTVGPHKHATKRDQVPIRKVTRKPSILHHIHDHAAAAQMFIVRYKKTAAGCRAGDALAAPRKSMSELSAPSHSCSSHPLIFSY
jgi:hypothetical protein